MKKIFTLFSCLFFFAICANAQPFWTENFESGMSGGSGPTTVVSAYTGPNGTWGMMVTGTEGAWYNQWYVSCAENGHTTGGCGTGCAPVSTTATLATLHVGSRTLGDYGASYDAGGLVNTTTDRRAESPVINCTGRYTITMKFYYTEDGDLALDDATVWYFDGTTWSLLDNTPKTPAICPGGQGYWDHRVLSLPASANNNPNVKIGFRWVNNNDGAGTDPSFAVDSVSLWAASSTSTTTSSFTTSSTGVCRDSCVTFTNTSTGTVDSFTWSISPAAPISTPHASPVVVCFSVAGTYTMTLTAYGGGTPYTSTHTVTVNPAPAAITGAHSICTGFTTTLANATAGGTWTSGSTATATVGSSTGIVTGVAAGTTNITYTLTATGCYAIYTFTVLPLPCTTGMPGTNTGNFIPEIYPNPATNELVVQVLPGTYTAYDITNEIGQSLIKAGINAAQTKINIKSLPAGLYYIRLKGDNGSVVRKFVKV